MKAKLIKEAVDFKRGQETIKGLDIGIQRSDNPNDYANTNSYKSEESNEEYLNQIIADLQDFHQSVAMDMSPMPEEVNVEWPVQNIPQIGSLRARMHSIENSLEDLIEFLKTVKR